MKVTSVATDTRPLGRPGRRFGILLAALLLVFSCESSAPDEPTGGETHFLTRCDASPGACGTRLSCVCGICTLPCSERAACQNFPVAECVAADAAACGNSPAQAHCDVSCASDADCKIVSSAHRCEAGACRAGTPVGGSGGMPGSGGSTTTGGTSGSGGAAGGAGGAGGGCEHGVVAANQVLVIGDSFFASNHQITAYLENLARDAGVLSAGERYRDNSRLAANGLALGGNGIGDQYTAGVAEAEVDVVIMNGGGADTLLGSCDTPDANCPILTAAASAAKDLLARMAQDGVQHVVYAYYPDPVDPTVRAKVDALRPLIQSACSNSPVPCHWLDLRNVFADHYGEYIQSDGLNPTATGSQASAVAIWTVLRDNCIAQ